MRDDTEQPEEKKPKRWISKVILGLLSLVLILAVLIQAALWSAVAWLNTQGGQEWINAQVESALVGTGYSVEMSGLSYRPFTTFVIGDLTVWQNDQLFVTGKNIYLHAELAPMMVKELIASASAEKIEIHKIEKPEPEVKEPLQLPVIAALALPDIYFRTISLSNIAVEDLKLSEDMSLSPSLSAKITLGKKLIRTKIKLVDDSGFIVKSLEASSSLALQDMVLSFDKLDVVSKDFVVSAKGHYDLKTPELNLDSVVKFLGEGGLEDILSSITAKNLEQAIGGAVHVETKVGEDQIVLTSEYETEGSKLDLKDLVFKGLGARAQGQVFLDQQNLAASGSGQMGVTKIDAFNLGIVHDQSPHQITFKATGTQNNHPIGADLSFKADVEKLTIEALVGSLSLRKSALKLSGAASKEKLDISADFKNFSLLDLPMDMTALSEDLILNGGFSLQGTAEIPVLESDFSIKPADGDPDVTIKAKGGFDNEILKYGFEAKGRGIKSLSGDISMPMQLSLMPFVFDVSQETALGGSVDVNLDVTSLTALVLPPDQEFSGLLKADGQIKGTLGAPDAVFSADMKGGNYHHKSVGLQLKDIALKATMANQIVDIQSLSASDGESGKLDASGFYDLKGQSFEIEVTSRELHALKGKIVDGVIDFDVDWQGDAKQSGIKGVVETGKITVSIPERFLQSIPSLNVVKKSERKKRIEPFGENIALDIEVKAPQQIFVSGWGLDAEFGGSLDITGTVYKPIVEGEFKSLRGRYEEFGKRFDIEHAKINFAKASPPSPQLDILTSTKSGDITAKIGITGDVQKPSLAFSSVPALPQDEVLSQILFGKSMEKITPFQAVELARTLQRFTGNGGGGGFNPMGLVKGLTGLDDIRVESDDDGETTIGAGKYLTDKVYLEFETGTGDAAGGANLEVEVTPNITVESEIGQDAQGGAGVFWNWDY